MLRDLVADRSHSPSLPLSKKTVKQLLDEIDTTRFDAAPTLLTVRKDGYSSSLLSVEQYSLVHHLVPQRSGDELADDARFQHFILQCVQGLTDKEHDIPWVHQQHQQNLWARSFQDWTVFPGDISAVYPHRPYCQAPPAHPLNATAWWIPALREAFSIDTTTRDHRGILNPNWIDCLHRAHDLFLRLAKDRLATIPDHTIRQLYTPLEQQWAARFDFRDLSRPLPYPLYRKVWVIAQAKTRDLLGMLNFFDRIRSRQYPLGPENPPWVYNFVGVKHNSVWNFNDRERLFHDGVPILEARYSSNVRKYSDYCYTDDWVKLQRKKLKEQYEGKCSFDPCQYRERQALTLHEVRRASRPNKRMRNRAQNYSAKQKEIDAQHQRASLDLEEGEESEKPTSKPADRRLQHTRQSILDNTSSFVPGLVYRVKHQSDAAWYDIPANHPIPQIPIRPYTGPASSTISQPSALTKMNAEMKARHAAQRDSLIELYREPYKSYLRKSRDGLRQLPSHLARQPPAVSPPIPPLAVPSPQLSASSPVQSLRRHQASPSQAQPPLLPVPHGDNDYLLPSQTTREPDAPHADRVSPRLDVSSLSPPQQVGKKWRLKDWAEEQRRKKRSRPQSP
ncbi:hypothetical protein CALVIDRAFT_563081 [Calocera viscosa TUFC12733]|uniref:Uncharacterized protein n=1 Tax=Calocera viscosa (strain TUFC12733) TaxID=1330018 RepID=A0A167N2R9_CALVF|nr:hypothetical protein CALVIDRAFT_563081 [Calocera viscosa TUFC12733]